MGLTQTKFFSQILADWYSETFFLKWLYNLLTGNSAIKSIKLTFLLVIFLSSGAGLFALNFTESAKLKDTFINIFLQLLVGVLLYIFLDLAFNSVEKYYGSKDYNFNYGVLAKKISDDSKEVKILTIFMRVFTPTDKIQNFSNLENLTPQQKLKVENLYKTEIAKRKANKKNFIDSVRHAIKNRAKIRILIMDPVSSAAKLRHEEVFTSIQNQQSSGSNYKRINQLLIESKYWIEDIQVIPETIRTLSFLIGLFQTCDVDLRNEFQVRIFDRIPPYSLFQVDEYISFSFYPGDRTIQDADRWNLSEGMPFERFMLKTFDDVWEDFERTYTLEQYMYVEIIEKGFEDYKVHYVELFEADNAGIPFWNHAICISTRKDFEKEKKHKLLFERLGEIKQQQGGIELLFRGKKKQAKIEQLTHDENKVGIPDLLGLFRNKYISEIHNDLQCGDSFAILTLF